MCHIKQVAGDPQATEINLMRHQRTKHPRTRHIKKRRPTGKQIPYKTPEGQVTNQVKKPYDNRKIHKMPHCCNKCDDSIHTLGFQCCAKKYQCKVCNKYGHFASLCYQKKTKCTTRTAEETPNHINFMQDQCMCKTVPITVIQKI